MNMKIIITLIVATSLITSCASGRQDKCLNTDLLCGADAWAVFLPGDKGKSASNIDLLNLQYKSADNKMGHDMAMRQIEEMNEDVKKAAANAFSKSTAQFEVMIRFTLTTSQPSSVEMVYKDAGITEFENLTKFRNQLASLTNYHSTRGTVYVVFHYLIRNATENNDLQYIKKINNLRG